MPKISELYFRTAILFLIAGVAVGLHMSIGGDHRAMGAHAHVNLLGWVTSALFGTYYALVPEKAAQRLAYVQYAVYTVGVLIMAPALYLLLTGNPGAEPAVALGSLVVAGGILLFAAIIFMPARPASLPRHSLAAE